MKKITLVALVLASSQLTGCMAMMEGLAEYGKTQQVNPQPTPNYYPTYTQPQVVQPQLSSPASHYYCNTIGGITTCKEI